MALTDVRATCDAFFEFEDSHVYGRCADDVEHRHVQRHLHYRVFDALFPQAVLAVIEPYFRTLMEKVSKLDASGALRKAGPNGMTVAAIFTHNGNTLPTFVRTHEGMGRQEVWGDAMANTLNHALTPLSECFGSGGSGVLGGGRRPMYPTYPWSLRYHGPQSGISEHTDQPDNEISLTYQVPECLCFPRLDHMRSPLIFGFPVS